MATYIGSRIKELRKKNGMTQKVLAKELGKSERMIQKYENDEVDPSLNILKKISEIFNANVDDLLITKRLDDADNLLSTIDFEKLESQINKKSQQIRNKYASSDDFCLYDIEVCISSMILNILGSATHSNALNYSLTDFEVDEVDELTNFVFNSYQLKVNEILERHKKSNTEKQI